MSQPYATPEVVTQGILWDDLPALYIDPQAQLDREQEQVMGEVTGKWRQFLTEELLGTAAEEEDDAIAAVDVMTIAAEGAAQQLAEIYGDVNPDSDALMAEQIWGRLNQAEQPPEFTFDIDDEGIFLGATVITPEIVDKLTTRAVLLGTRVYMEERSRIFGITLKEGQ